MESNSQMLSDSSRSSFGVSINGRKDFDYGVQLKRITLYCAIPALKLARGCGCERFEIESWLVDCWLLRLLIGSDRKTRHAIFHY